MPSWLSRDGKSAGRRDLLLRPSSQEQGTPKRIRILREEIAENAKYSIDMDNARNLLLELETIEAQYALATNDSEKAILEAEHLSISQEMDATMTNIRLSQKTAHDELENGANEIEINTLAAPHDLAYNQKAISALQLKHWAHGSTPSASDISDLSLIAYQCPLEGGNAVYRARALLKTTGAYTFEHIDCIPEQQIQAMPANQTANYPITERLELRRPDQLEYWRIYPNPAHTNFSVIGFDEVTLDKVQLYSLAGQLLEEWNTSFNYSSLPLPSNLTNGIYWVKLTGNDGLTSYKKLVVAQ